jgi:hypothetical protein
MLIPVILIFLIALLGAGYYFARVALFPRVYGVDYVLKQEIESGNIIEEAYKSWPKEEIRIHSPYGYDLYAVYHHCDNAQKTVIISHGITWNRYGSVKYASLFRKHGFNVLLYDLRNHGRSGGSNTTFGFYEKYDLKAVVDWAFAQLGSLGKVGTLGESLGASTTLQHAALDPRIAFAIADCPFSDLVTLFTYRLKEEYHLPSFPLLPTASLISWFLTGMRFEQVSPIREMAKIHAPVMFVHGKEDRYIYPEMSVALYNAKTNGTRKLYLAPNAAHAQSLTKNRVEYEQQVAEFLQSIGL